jgi:hypothetical protein
MRQPNGVGYIKLQIANIKLQISNRSACRLVRRSQLPKAIIAATLSGSKFDI